MRTGTAISAAGHGLLIVLAIWGLPHRGYKGAANARAGWAAS